VPNPSVSIVINNFNYDKFIAQAIRSALHQTLRATEVIVVDDGSTDNSRKIIESFGQDVKPVWKQNGGQASAFNAGFSASSGDVICLLDADDIFKPEKLEVVVDTFERNPPAQWLFHPLELFNSDPQKSWPDLRGPIVMTGERDFRSAIQAGRLHFLAPATSGCCFRRELLAQILPMPTASGIAMCDNFLKFAAMALGSGFYMGRSLALQRIHGNNILTFRKDRKQLQARIKVHTAFWLRQQFPVTQALSDKLLSAGIAQFLTTGGFDDQCKSYSRDYYRNCTAQRKFSMSARIAYYAARSAARRARA
jgi:glycosyltransferase involved in cell wall biosynthesis